MKQVLYFSGRTLQFLGLLILPSGIWVTEVMKSEAAAVGVLFGGIGVFFVGWLLTEMAR